MSVIVKIVAVLLALVVLFLAVFGVSYFRQASKDNSMLERIDTKYYTDESGNRIANIPYDDYIGGVSLPENYVAVDGLSETNTGEDLICIMDKIGEYSMTGYPEITRVSHIYILNHELSKYWDLPCYGLVVKHTENIQYDDYNVTPRTCNEREKLYIDDVID